MYCKTFVVYDLNIFQCYGAYKTIYINKINKIITLFLGTYIKYSTDGIYCIKIYCINITSKI